MLQLRKWVKPLVITLVVLAVLIACFTFIFQAPYTFHESGATDGNFSRVISSVENISAANPKINEIAVLGSHDALSDAIEPSSEIDPAEQGALAKIAPLVAGMQYRYSVAQDANLAVQLNCGVRYVDIRASYYQGEWWTKHFFLSGKLSDYIMQLLEFLADNPGEFVILDFQHIYFGEKSIEAFMAYLDTVTLDGKSIYDYVYYDADVKPFGELRYNDVCQDGKSGLVLFYFSEDKPFDEVTSPYLENFYSRETNVRSLWHNTTNESSIIRQINEEAAYLNSTDRYDDCLRINQAQQSFAASSIFSALFKWSLLKIAEDYNVKLIENENFSEWLSVMPVFMVDFSTSTKGNFNTRVNNLMIKYNTALCANG